MSNLNFYSIKNDIMRKLIVSLSVVLISVSAFTSCTKKIKKDSSSAIEFKISQFPVEKLNADLSLLSSNEKKMIPFLMKACDIMDELYWEQTFGDKKAGLAKISDTLEQKFFITNYGPWERMRGCVLFTKGFDKRLSGANYYPKDITKEAFIGIKDSLKNSPYTLIKKDNSGKLVVVKYSDEYKEKLKQAANQLVEASKLADDANFKKYLVLRAEALLTDDFDKSDEAWLEVKNSNIDIAIGPIETYEDEFMGIKTAYQGVICIKDPKLTGDFEKFEGMLPALQKDLPIEEKYKKPINNSTTRLQVFNMIYCKGYPNAEGKAIAMSLPNNPKVTDVKGTRNLYLKNVMKMKFDNILMPISQLLISSEQAKNIKFEAFFNNIMFQKMSHLLGIKELKEGVNISETLEEQNSVLEEVKSNMLGLYLASKFFDMKVIKSEDISDYYVTYLSGIFRSIRFGTTNFQGKANMLIFNIFEEIGAIRRDASKGAYTIVPDKMSMATDMLLKKVLVLQGNQDYKGFTKLMNQKGIVKVQLQQDLEKLKGKNIPVDIVFQQGLSEVGLK